MNLFDNERYYLIKRVPKSSSGQNVNRSGETGFWRAAQTKPIKDSNDGVIGIMNHLNFYAYDAQTNRAVKTHWIMHEYILHTNDTTSVSDAVSR